MWGAGDQGRVNKPILDSLGCEIVALVDDTRALSTPFPGTTLLHGWLELEPWLATQDVRRLGFVVAIGNPFGHVRCELHQQLTARGITPVSFADASVLICRSAEVAAGLQAMPLAMVHSDAVIGRQCILNTRSLIEHDCVLEDGVEVGPGAVLCGRVHVGANSWVGAGATIRPRIHIGKNVIVGAGAVVIEDIPDGIVVVGVPAHPMTNRNTASIIANLQGTLR